MLITVAPQMLSEVPAITKTGLTEYEADLIVTVTNLYQRSFADLSHSELAAKGGNV